MAAKEEVITAIYKVNLHCPQCAAKIKRPLLRTQGVQSVEVDVEKSEIKVKGAVEVIKIHKLIEKWSKRKVELISPQLKKETPAADNKVAVKEIKESIVRTTSVKIHMHCDKCEHDLRKKLLRHRGIHSVKTDFKAQTVTVQGTIESEKLLSYFRTKVHKHAEIITSKPEVKKEEKKETIEIKSTEVKTKETVTPYFIHYVYAPQIFSDENPNACIVM